MATPSADVEAPAGRDAAKVAAIGAGVLGLGLSIAAFATFGLRSGLSVAAGAAIAVANLVTMSAIIRALLRPAEAEAEAIAAAEAEKAEAKARGEEPSSTEEEDESEPPVDHVREGKRGGAAWGLFAVLKILVLFGGIFLLLTKGLVDPIALVVGYGVLPLGIAASSLVNSLSPRPRGKRASARRPPSRTR
jgi:hypothetical protein